MADNKKGGMLQPTPYNEAPGDPESGNISGGGIYATYEEAISAQLSSAEASLVNSPNMLANDGIFGGPAPGEPQVANPKVRPTG
jgi:hypothetical protein